MKILINTPRLDKGGGVSTYCSVIKPYFTSSVEYFTAGSSIGAEGVISSVIRMVSDYVHFFRFLRQNSIDLIHLNPSLGYKAVIRDGIFLLIAKAMGKKVVVFFHGWNGNFERIIQRYFLSLFKMVFFQADTIVVLASSFRMKLFEWGYKGTVLTETTTTDNEMFKHAVSVIASKKSTMAKNRINILFIARIEREKGIYEALEIYHLLKNRHSELSMTIVGDGSELEKMRDFASKLGCLDVEFTGFLRGDELRNAYAGADIFLFPSHGEGFPIAVIEAMAYGLPVLARPVGGLPDFFEDGRMGFLIDSFNSNDWAVRMEQLLADPSLRLSMGEYNHQFAHEHFRPASIVRRLEDIYSQLKHEQDIPHILMTTPHLDKLGGVATYCGVIRTHFTMSIEYLSVGSKSKCENFLYVVARNICTLMKYYWILRTKKIDLVHINPSFGYKSIIRDGLSLIIARALNKKVIVFFHGWDSNFEKLVRRYFMVFFRNVYSRADAIIVLAKVFKANLLEIGFKVPIYIETTTTDEKLFDHAAQFVPTRRNYNSMKTFNILFLARIEKAKGIYEALEAFHLIKLRYPFVSMAVVGDGEEIEKIREFVVSKGMQDVEIAGFRTGEQLRDSFTAANAYLFPSKHGEGFPISVIEAMIYGMPIITSSVGGIADYFEDGKMGFLSKSCDPLELTLLLERLIINRELCLKMGEYNFSYAQEHFRPHSTVRRLEGIYRQVLAVSQ